DLAEELGVIRDGHEVERTVDGRAAGLLLVRVGDGDRRAAREIVRVARPDARAEDVGVGREAGVHVEVAEEGLPERRDGGTRVAGLSTMPRRRLGGREGSTENEGKQRRKPPHASCCTPNSRSLSSNSANG